MELNVAAELKLAGRPSSRHFEENMQPIDFGGHKLVFTMPVSVDLTYVFDGEGFSVAGVLSSRLMMNCTKCNEEFEQDFSVDFSERFIKTSENEAEELECYPFNGETLDLNKMVFDLIILNAPLYGLCKPDCKGLCPVCGCNLNTMQCSCSKSVKNANFSSLEELAQLLNDEEEV
ncbi:MAG: DUF177 domain-containing protein [Eubacteriales bacterium]|nr:DUF177 domain-containing protein [Eubacteriales bacterium]MCI7778898.1 DUF177 domain-containing protein [Clostridiales bacterium]MDD6017356.1 DUF177 domain-containing protein [Clostridiales bacterium]MDD7489184.1 DUF177 domain-containing protein [Clostridiales bacterium]MDD7523644.1 DUF177 domain-containing protein [Clostridiales bacterium]